MGLPAFMATRPARALGGTRSRTSGLMSGLYEKSPMALGPLGGGRKSAGGHRESNYRRCGEVVKFSTLDIKSVLHNADDRAYNPSCSLSNRRDDMTTKY